MNGRVAVPAKINLALVVGRPRGDGLHPIATVMQRIDLCDELELEPADELQVAGFDADTLVRRALEAVASAAGVQPRWRARLRKSIPTAAGLGGGSADAAAALVLANRNLPTPLARNVLLGLAAGLGADVPFFLEPGPKLVQGVGERLDLLDLPQDYSVLVALGHDAVKPSTAEVYGRFDRADGGPGFEKRRERLLGVLRGCRQASDLAALPANDLAAASGVRLLPERLRAAGAFRVDVSGAGPCVYALFLERRQAAAAARELRGDARTWVVAPVW